MNPVITIAIRIVALTLAFVPLTVLAEGAVLTGRFDGAERTMPRTHDPFGCGDRPAGFQAVAFEVSRTGAYGLSDPFYNHFYWLGSSEGYTLQIHRGAFEPSAPDPVPASDGLYMLQSGRGYSLVIHARCPGFEGAWAAGITGPGSTTSNAVADLPSFSLSAFTPANPTMTSDCGSGYYAWGWGPVPDLPYAEVGPIRLKRGGTYYYGAVSGQACLAIYTAPVDPANRHSNRVAVLSGYDTTVALEADTDYWFVSQHNGWDRNSRYGEYLHVLVPPATFRINAGLNGAWYDPATPGEGFFISVFDSLNNVFLAHFTYSDRAVPGDPYGHRWYTAAGPVTGDSAELDLELTAGGAFNEALPAPRQVQIGRLRLRFVDCAHGSLVVDAGGPDGAQSAGPPIPLRRLGGDWEQVCRSQYEGLDEVGPL